MIALVISPDWDGNPEHRLALIDSPPEPFAFFDDLIPYLDPNRWFASYSTALQRANALAKEHGTYIHTYRYKETFYAARKRVS